MALETRTHSNPQNHPPAQNVAPEAYAAELRRFKARTERSRSEWERARRYLPSGVCSNFRLMEPGPLFLHRARGSRVEDVDGNSYIDWGMAQSTLLAGHAHPVVLDAVRRQIESGTMTCYPHPRTADVAEIACSRFRLDQVRFVNTGAEATMYALRVARGATGRDAILKFDIGYHGGSAEFWKGKAVVPLPPGAPAWLGQEVFSAGVPRAFLDETVVASYNDLHSVEDCFRRHPGRIAAIILEPVAFNLGICPPRDGFLQGLRAICDREGAVLIFDEVKMGCKLGLLGAGEYFGVRPDLVCMAKSIGGGFPIGLFGGRRELMQVIETGNVLHVGTYAANQIGLAAAQATLTEVLTPENYRRIFALNDALAAGYRDIIERTGIDAQVVTIGASGCLFMTRARVDDRMSYARSRTDAWLRFWVGMANRGVLPQSYGPEDIWTVSVQHTGEDVDATLRAFREVAPLLA